PDLGELPHHLRPSEGLRQEDDIRVTIADFGDQPLPEWQGLRMRIVDTEDPNALLDPEQHDVAQGDPDRGQRITVEMDVDDVLVALRRVLGKLDRPVWPPVEPFRMLLEPGMVGRALDREVEGNLEPLGSRSCD